MTLPPMAIIGWHVDNAFLASQTDATPRQVLIALGCEVDPHYTPLCIFCTYSLKEYTGQS
jgi:hypothetical protein